MVDNRGTTYSHHALAELAERGAALIVCGRDHHPVGMYLPISNNTCLLSRLDAQLNMSKPVRKRLWAAIVVAKIKAQAAALPFCKEAEPCRTKLLGLATQVRSGDATNMEAQAAAAYWPMLFVQCTGIEQPFRRKAGHHGASPPNNLLDYGYAALRAALARAIVSAGLLPALGIHHHGRSNPFCLADDLMEPLRPLIDRRARWLAQRDELELNQPTKAELLAVLTDEIKVAGIKGPLLVGVTRYVASFVRVISGQSKTIDIPVAEPDA